MADTTTKAAKDLRAGDIVTAGALRVPFTVATKPVKSPGGIIVVADYGEDQAAVTFPPGEVLTVEPKGTVVLHARGSYGYGSNGIACSRSVKTQGAIAASPGEITCKTKTCSDVRKRWETEATSAGTVAGKARRSWNNRTVDTIDVEWIAPFARPAEVTLPALEDVSPLLTFTATTPEQLSKLHAMFNGAVDAINAIQRVHRDRVAHPEVTGPNAVEG